MSEFIIDKIEFAPKVAQESLPEPILTTEQAKLIHMREELILLRNIAIAAATYIQQTKTYQDLDSWRGMKESLKKWGVTT